MRIFGCLLALMACVIISAQTASAAPPVDPQFTAFWEKFKAALAKRDKQAVVAMTKLPYMLDSKNLNKQQFLAKFDYLFPKSVSACFKKQKPVLDQGGSYFAFCGEQIYIFSKVNGKWMFDEIGVND